MDALAVDGLAVVTVAAVSCAVTVARTVDVGLDDRIDSRFELSGGTGEGAFAGSTGPRAAALGAPLQGLVLPATRSIERAQLRVALRPLAPVLAADSDLYNLI